MERSQSFDHHFPSNVLDMVRLKPLYRIADGPMQNFDDVFPLNSTVADVYNMIRAKAPQFDILDSNQTPVSMDMYLLEYLAHNKSIVFLRERTGVSGNTYEGSYGESAYGNSEGASYPGGSSRRVRAMPLESLPSSALYLDPSDFRHEFSRMMADAGLPARVEIFNHNLEQLPENVPYVADWLLHTYSRWFILVPLGSSLYMDPLLMPELESLPNSSGEADGQIVEEELVQNERRPRQKTTIQLRPGIDLSISSDHFSLENNGMTPSPLVTEALQEFLALYETEQPPAVASPTTNGITDSTDTQVDYTELGSRLRHALSGSRLMAGLETFSDEKIAKTAVEILRSGSSPDTAMAYRLAQDYIELKNKVRQLEARRVRIRIPRQLNTAWQVAQVVGSRLFTFAVFLSQQDLTPVVLYSIFWFAIINILDISVKFAVPVALYLFVNVFLMILQSRWHIDVTELLCTYCFPKVYPENPAVALNADVIRVAATQLLQEQDVNYNDIIDSLITVPSMGQKVAISVFSTIPSMLSKWHAKLDLRREKTREAIIAAIEGEKSRLASAQENADGADGAE